MIFVRQFNTAKIITLLIIQILLVQIVNLNKLANLDLKHLNNWFSANKISLNINKNELLIFKSTRKILSNEIKIKLSGKKLHLSKSVKYLGVRMDKILQRHYQVNNIVLKLSRANKLLVIIRSYEKYRICKWWKIVEFPNISIDMKDFKTFYRSKTVSHLKEIIQPNTR